MSAASAPTKEELNPSPPVWPQCEVCEVAYVYRRCISWTQGWIWAWQRDCEKPKSRCKGAVAVFVNADGDVLYRPGDESVPASGGPRHDRSEPE